VLNRRDVIIFGEFCEVGTLYWDGRDYLSNHSAYGCRYTPICSLGFRPKLSLHDIFNFASPVVIFNIYVLVLNLWCPRVESLLLGLIPSWVLHPIVSSRTIALRDVILIWREQFWVYILGCVVLRHQWGRLLWSLCPLYPDTQKYCNPLLGYWNVVPSSVCLRKLWKGVHQCS
jgi:hypothetical protein